MKKITTSVHLLHDGETLVVEFKGRQSVLVDLLCEAITYLVDTDVVSRGIAYILVMNLLNDIGAPDEEEGYPGESE